MLVASGVTAFAAIPDSTTKVIQGCYRTSDGLLTGPKGSLRVIDKQAGENCRTGETTMSWNQQGPKGDPGPQGIQGLQGPQGPAGPAGTVATGQVFFESNDEVLDIHQVAENIVTLRLPPGSYVVEGRVVLYASAPIADNFGVSIVCRLGETETYFHPVVQKRAPGTWGWEQLELTTAMNLTEEADVKLTCDGFGQPDARGGPATLLATPVGAVNPTPTTG